MCQRTYIYITNLMYSYCIVQQFSQCPIYNLSKKECKSIVVSFDFECAGKKRKKK